MKTSLFTVSFAGFWGQHQLSLEESILKTAELGYESVEIMCKRPHLSILDYSINDCEKLAKFIKKTGISVSALAGYTNFTGGMDFSEIPFVEMQINYVEELAKRAQILNAPIVRIFSAYDRTDISFARQWQVTTRAIAECCDRAKQYKVAIGLQNHHDLGADTKSLAELVKQVNCPNLIPLFDCWNPHLRGENLAQSTKLMASKMKFTTVADYVVIPRTRYQPDLVNYSNITPAYVMAVPMGEGDLDYSIFFKTLQKSNYQGVVSYEMCSPLRDGGDLKTLENYAKIFLKYMEQFQ
jgi:sugar phosphate isomerase/epimerase